MHTIKMKNINKIMLVGMFVLALLSFASAIDYEIIGYSENIITYENNSYWEDVEYSGVYLNGTEYSYIVNEEFINVTEIINPDTESNPELRYFSEVRQKDFERFIEGIRIWNECKSGKDTVIVDCSQSTFEGFIQYKILSEEEGYQERLDMQNNIGGNITADKVSANIGNFDLITDNSPSWNEELSKSEECLLNTDLSSSNTTHLTICAELKYDEEIIVNKVVRMLWWFMQDVYQKVKGHEIILDDHENRLTIAQERVLTLEDKMCELGQTEFC